ncbi:rhomboid family intramembrane serine protease [Amylibacter sp. IMCC11727]|uniref:rhomboid family intramembrane serine protease n=1 Tax=Amylibacter sp. IMCC11727 TaxID=3039851 RepID=UPI00244E1AEC|nr:rhomboid family intramembrane serine protease [Amylibacter sp. IMCC11727]WGI22976.1 rhomboid family intramembrane serine protease [Amylibacter sp. IMCC11727]
MFPIRDHNPSRNTPYVTYALLFINIVVFLAYYPALSTDPHALGGFWDTWAIVPAEIVAGQDLMTLLTGMFLHGGWMHLIGNVLFLYIFGDNIEDAFGHVRFLLFYLFCGLAASAIQIIADPTSSVPVVGASGAIAGVLGGYLLLYPKARVDIIIIFIIFFKTFTLPAWIVLCGWFGMQIFGGLSTPSTGGGVAYWAHIGGFGAGLLIALPYWVSHGANRFWQRTEGHPPHPPTNAPTTIPVVRRRR